MKKIIFLCAIAILALSYGCSSTQKDSELILCRPIIAGTVFAGSIGGQINGYLAGVQKASTPLEKENSSKSSTLN